MTAPRFGYVSPAPIQTVDGDFLIETRTLDSLDLMAELLPGPLTLLSPGIQPVDAEAPGGTRLPAGTGKFDVVHVDPDAESLNATGLDLVYGLHSTMSEYVTRSTIPFVLTSEQTLRMRMDLFRADLSGVSLARACAGLLPREVALRGQVRRAASLQCNGPAASRWYGGMKPDTLTFHDSRIHATDVAKSVQHAGWDGNGRLQVGFSGRLTAIKGPQFAVAVAAAAHQKGLPVDLHVFGVGPMEQELRAAAGPNVFFEGFQPFQTAWVPFVRESIDLMLFPHVQGDPSCTYFEALGCGAPILAFDNSTATPLVRDHAFGWTVPQKDVAAMISTLEAIFERPDRLSSARDAGHAFMADHHFEATTRARAAHLVGQLS